MHIQPWELRDPAEVIRVLDEEHRLRAGQVIVGLVERPSTDQLLVASEVIWTDPEPPPLKQVRGLLRTAARDLYADRDPDAYPIDHSYVTVVARHGRVVLVDDVLAWAYGWLYCSHQQPVYKGALLTVTEHGWRSFDNESAGAVPALRAAS
jgi:hypothetical protein